MEWTQSPFFGLVPATKTPLKEGWSDGSYRITPQEAETMKTVGFVPPKGYCIVDADDEESVKQIETLLQQIGKLDKVFSYPTTRGKHFVFKTPDGELFDSISSSNGGTIFMPSDGKASKIDVKAGGRNGKNGYVKVKGEGVWRVKPDELLKAFETAIDAPVALLISKKFKISVEDYKSGARDDTAFKWLAKLRGKGITKEQWIQLMLTVKLAAGDPEDVNETVEWATRKWESSVSMGEVKDFEEGSDEEKGEIFWKKAFEYSEAGTVNGKKIWLARDVRYYDVLADHFINEYKLQTSYEDNQIWGMEKGVFKPIENFDSYIRRVIVSEVGNIKPSIFSGIKTYIESRLPMKTFSTNRFAVTFLNKTIDVSILQEINLSKDIMNQNTIPHNFDGLDESSYEKEIKFLDSMMKGWTKGNKDIEKELYELIGLCMIKYTGLEKAYFLLGTGANGKSMFLKYLINILGTTNVSHEDLKDLSEDKFSSSELYGKLANINTDISANVIEDPSLFKKIVSGDRIAGENKGQRKFRFAPYATHVFGANNIPYAKEMGDSDAINRRLKIITFNATFKKSGSQKSVVEMENTLLSKRVIELGIIRGIKAVHNALRTEFTESSASIKTLEEHKREMNHLYDFIEEEGIKDNESIISAHKRYQAWCKQYGYTAWALTNFVKKYKNAARGLGKKIHTETFDYGGVHRHRILMEGDDE